MRILGKPFFDLSCNVMRRTRALLWALCFTALSLLDRSNPLLYFVKSDSVCLASLISQVDFPFLRRPECWVHLTWPWRVPSAADQANCRWRLAGSFNLTFAFITSVMMVVPGCVCLESFQNARHLSLPTQLPSKPAFIRQIQKVYKARLEQVTDVQLSIFSEGNNHAVESETDSRSEFLL
jgi:hypothetical protein